MKSFRRFLPYLKPYWGLLLTSLLLAIPLSAIRASPVAMVQYLIDEILVKRDITKLAPFCAIVVGIWILNIPVRFFHNYLLRIVIARVNQKVKNALHDHLLGLSSDYFTSQSTGSLMSRVISDPAYLDGALSNLAVVIREPLTFLTLLIYAFKLNWKLTSVSFLIFPPLAWVFSVSAKHIKRYIHKLTEENARVFSTLQETFTGIRVVKTFRLERYVRNKFWERTDEFARIYLKISKLEEISHPLVELLIGLVFAVMIYFGGRQVIHNHITAGELLAFFTTFGIMINPLKSLNEVNLKFSQAIGACDRISQVLDWKTHLHEPAKPVPLKRFADCIEIDGVSFSYPDAPERPVLSNVSFSLKRGRKVALVGASGAGKSSLVNLLPRIFDVSRGVIRIDGHDIRELVIEDLRRLIAVVTQDVFLFNDTIEENIRCGRLGATAEEVREAALRAHATEFIEKLPEGFATRIGDRGQKLSGGQRQRLSIARAFLRQSPILILDEATSALDTTSERAVQAALEELMKDRTTLIIAHRLSTIQNADEIYVIKDGSIVESGRHEELLQKRGEYASFYLVTEETPSGSS